MTDAPPAGDPAAPATYLIVLRHVLVAQDIAMTIAEHDPSARVIVAATGAEAVQALDGPGPVAVAFVGKGPEAFRASPLAPALTERGARVVLMGEEAERDGEAQGFAVLTRPFSTGNILVHLNAGAG
jgi:hypothetical protein